METSGAGAGRELTMIRDEGDALVALAQGAWEAPVPTCPGWDVGGLLVHTSGAHRWATANVASRERVRQRDVPTPPTGMDAQIEWYREGLAGLLDVVGSTPPETQVWTFGASGQQTAGWWARRMALETGVHRWDAANASGQRPAAFEPDLAVAGIDEYLVDMVPRLKAETWEGLSGTLHVHAHDAEGEWVFDLDDPNTPARREHAKSDTAVRGNASDLLLWLWNRQPAAGHLEVLGNASVVEAWAQVKL